MLGCGKVNGDTGAGLPADDSGKQRLTSPGVSVCNCSPLLHILYRCEDSYYIFSPRKRGLPTFDLTSWCVPHAGRIPNSCCFSFSPLSFCLYSHWPLKHPLPDSYRLEGLGTKAPKADLRPELRGEICRHPGLLTCRGRTSRVQLHTGKHYEGALAENLFLLGKTLWCFLNHLPNVLFRFRSSTHVC